MRAHLGKACGGCGKESEKRTRSWVGSKLNLPVTKCNFLLVSSWFLLISTRQEVLRNDMEGFSVGKGYQKSCQFSLHLTPINLICRTRLFFCFLVNKNQLHVSLLLYTLSVQLTSSSKIAVLFWGRFFKRFRGS